MNVLSEHGYLTPRGWSKLSLFFHSFFSPSRYFNFFRSLPSTLYFNTYLFDLVLLAGARGSVGFIYKAKEGHFGFLSNDKYHDIEFTILL